MSSELFKLVSEKALENTDTVIAEKVNPVLGALGIAGLTATATIPVVKNIDNIKNYFSQSETNMGKPVKAEQLKTGYGITYIDSKGNKLVKQGGDISKLANNPGNIALPKSGFGPKNKQKFKDLGAIGWFVGKSNVFAVFPDEETGKKALYTWFFSGDRDDWTIKKTMNIYAPVSENNTERYLNFIKNHGISLDSKLSDLSNSQQDILISAIIKMEGKHPVKSEQFIPAEPKLTNNVQKVSVKESLENNVDILTKAKNYFGLTTSISEAGYILPNGTMLDFSGKKFGGSPNRRSMDHREISSAFDSEEITMPDIVELGCIRIDGDLGYVSMAILPTNAQFETLENIMYKKGHIDVECAKNITDWYNNHNLFYKEYNGYNFERVKKDIINYYSNKPLTKLQVFHENNLNNINSKSEKIEMGDKELNRFYKWFGNSKVVDKQNRPLVVYHGTNHIFDKFSKRKSLSNTHMNELGAGFYFSPYIEDAESYGSNILSFYLRIENPFIASKEQLQLLKDYTNLNFEIDNIKEIEDIIDIVNELGIRKFPRILIELGFDGIILYGQYVVFNANQMKAAEYGNDGHYRRSSNNFNESITLNEATGIPMWDDNIEDYITGAFYCFTGNELQNILDNNLHHEDARVIYEFNKGVYLLTESINAIHNQILEMAIINTKLFDSLGNIKQIKEENEGQVTLICEEARKYLDLITFKIFRNMETDTDEQFLEFLVRLPDNWTDDYSEGFACKLNNTTWAICRYNELNKIKQIPIFNGKEWISLKEINEKLSEDEEELNESQEEVKKIIAYHGSQTDKLQFMKNHALYLTDNYDLAYEFATKDGDGGLIDGEVATLYTCELNLKKVYETYSEAEYDSNFIDVSFNREKWLEKGYNAIIIHPTEASKTTYYIMLNPEEDVKIIDKEIIDYGDLLNEVIICFKSNNLVEGIHGTVSDRNAKYFIKKAEENGFRFAGWDKGHRSYTTDSLYFKIIGNTIYQCRSSDHSKPDELKANDIDTYITLSEFNPNKIDEIVDDLIRRNSIMNKCIQIYSEKLNDTFIKDYIINSINNTNNNKYLMSNLLKKHNLYSVKVDVQKYIWFKQLLKNKVEEFLEKHPEYQKYYHQIGITEWSEENNYLKNGW